ncbi:hypothetical protein AAEX28_10230 [Lentisphaerota bacterium WC36G]|nr:hypothetical protein LJT99_13070 [Lentisphaerae bacterium WC36]
MFSKWGSASSRYHLAYVYLLLFIVTIGAVFCAKLLKKRYKKLNILSIAMLIIVILFGAGAGKSFRFSGQRKIYRQDTVKQIQNYLKNNHYGEKFILYTTIGEHRNFTFFGASDIRTVVNDEELVSPEANKEWFIVCKFRKKKKKPSDIQAESFMLKFLAKLQNLNQRHSLQKIEVKRYQINKKDTIYIFHIKRMSNKL